MGQQFDRVAIALTPGGTEYVVLESQLVIDFGQGQGPQGGVITVKDGWVTIQGAGEARLDGGQEEQGGTFPPHLTLKGKGKLAVEIAAHEDPTGNPSKATVYLEGASATLRMRDRIFLDGTNGDVWLGGKNVHGDIMLYNKDQPENRDSAKATIRLAGAAGEITMRSAAGEDRIFLDASKGDLWLGGKNVQGDIMLFPAGEEDNRNSAKATIRLNGGAGDIVLQNADCAEDFDIAEDTVAAPGTVMVITDTGQLAPSAHTYDTRVAGVVSGAGGLQPGIRLGRLADGPARTPVALVGKVFCKVDAAGGPIEVGSLLTTSDTPGHAMRVSNQSREVGTVLGKALAPHHHGLGLIPILVTLQ
jgi:hypothetical protein